MGRNRTGAKGADVVLKVPVGTQVFDEDNETLIADLTEVGQRVRCSPRAAMAASATPISRPRPTRRRAAPIPAWTGEEKWIWLRLKLIADAGLVGLPNAGKSTFLAAVTRGQAEDRRLSVHHAASQPRRRPDRRRANSCSPTFPGLIEGAHEGAGLGDRFLGHVERCARAAPPGRRHRGGRRPAPTARSAASSRPMATALADKPEIVALSKVDALDAGRRSKRSQGRRA